MEFETKVLDLLMPYLSGDELAEFFEGTLFIETDILRGRLINDILKENGYNTILNVMDNEVAFDFV